MAVMVTSSEGGEFQIPDEGTYVLELTQVGEPRTEPNQFWHPKGDQDESDRPMRTSIYLQFEVAESPDDEDQIGLDLREYYTLSLGNEKMPSKLRPVVTAFLGRPVEDDDELDLEDFLSQRIRGTVTHGIKKNGDTKAMLEAPLPLRKKKAKPAPPPPVEDDDDTDDDPFPQ